MGYPKLTPVVATGGSAPRYLGDRFGDVINVKDYGAVGDGVTDDTVAFAAAAAISAHVLVPGGTYKLSDNVTGLFFSFDYVSITGTNGAVNGKTAIHSIARLEVPVGTVIWHASASVPYGFLLCNGAAVSRTTYSDLFSSIETTYGAGDGSTTFNLPNLIDRFPQGNSTPGTVKSAGLPNIIGYSNVAGHMGTGISSSGAFSTTTRWDKNFTTTSGTNSGVINFDASYYNAIYGGSTTVQPPALTLVPCIKYLAQ